RRTRLFRYSSLEPLVHQRRLHFEENKGATSVNVQEAEMSESEGPSRCQGERLQRRY
uniref:Uncharacterized protein n=1 Tax=Mesocestoides corti TaxID=53468 RepID=A0A5K3F6H7_MESCO